MSRYFAAVRLEPLARPLPRSVRTNLGDQASRSPLSHYAPGEYPGWPDGLTDDTHFSVTGARRIAAFVALSLRAIAGLDGDQPAKGRRGIVP
ncbi:hypothetical protein [Microbacterium sp. GXS0129]|uniref:hypothetical protein n=1 Tax=Microbacterium sp. GXS0129 TaxID=3377836 RepID=UPI00383A385E